MAAPRGCVVTAFALVTGSAAVCLLLLLVVHLTIARRVEAADARARRVVALARARRRDLAGTSTTRWGWSRPWTGRPGSER